jgi:hypothetical protein
VVRALERLTAAAADGDGAAAVQAHVREGAQLAVAPARHDDLLAGDLAREVLARLGDLLGTTDEVPDLAEQRALLELVELGRGVPVVREGAGALDAQVVPGGNGSAHRAHLAVPHASLAGPSSHRSPQMQSPKAAQCVERSA